MRSLIFATGAAFLAAGCAVKPVAMTEQAHQGRAAADQRRLFDDQERVEAPLTLHDAIARALRYNMEYRVRLMEEAAALGQTGLASYDMLPRLTAAAGYSWRNNDAFGFGFSQSGAVADNPSASSERRRGFENITFSWNALDFGMSYLRAKQLADQSLIAEERRRKAVQTLVMDVRNAWWRVEAAQRLIPEADALLAEIGHAGARARLIETRKLLPPLQIVAYKRSLLDLEQQISARRQELVQVKLELAQLLNLRPGLEYSVAPAQIDDPVPPDLSARVEALEQIAVANRPELREEGYRARITDLEADKQLLALLPSVSLDAGLNHDSNRYLVNNSWSSAGLNLSWNLFKLASLPAQREAGRAAASVDQTRRLALMAAVLGQTRIAAVRYRLLCDELAIWDEALGDDIRIVGYLNAAKQVGLETELELIRAKGRGMLSKINRDLVYANVQGAAGRLYNSIGVDSLPPEMESRAPAALASELAKTLDAWSAQNFAPRAGSSQAPVAVMAVGGVADKVAAEAFTSSLKRILLLSKVATTSAAADEPAPYRIESSVALAAPGISGQNATMKLRLLDAGGAVLFESEQSSMLMTPVGPEQWRALGEGAGYRVTDPVRRYLVKAGAAADAGAPAAPMAPAPDPAKVASAAELRGAADAVEQDNAAALAAARKRGQHE